MIWFVDIISILIIYQLLVPFALASKSGKYILFNAKIAALKPLKTEGINPSHFSEWFSREEIPLEILKLNPSLEKIETLDNKQLRGYLKPIKFPGISVTSVIDFETNFEQNNFEVVCNEGAIKQSFEGNKILISLFSTLSPVVVSKTTWFVDVENGSLGNDSNLQIRFGIPSWFPFDVNNSEKEGGSVIQKNLESDVKELSDRILNLYRNWAHPN